MNKYCHLLFDLDHTLWDFDRNSRDTLEELFNEYGMNAFFKSFEDFLADYNLVNYRLWDDYGKGMISKDDVKYKRFINCLANAGSDRKDLACQMAEEYVSRSPCKTHLVEGAIELLQALSGKYGMHIITNGFNEVQYKKIRLSGLSPFFDNIFTSEDAGFQKPDEGFFNFVFSSNGMKKEGSLVIGDNIRSDIEGAKNYGLDTIFYNPSGQEDFAGATFMVSHLDEIQGLL